MVQNTKDNGKMIFSMGKVWNLGQMDHAMKVIMNSGESMVLVRTSGMMEVCIQESGKRIKYQE